KLEPFPKWNNVSIRLPIDPHVRPVKLESALSQDIIKPVHGQSEWISPIVITFK
ncbi:hypothetical protein KR032_004504, partial [Drosophila birchii]